MLRKLSQYIGKPRPRDGASPRAAETPPVKQNAMSTRRPPEGSLQLTWVFGYNGHTSRNNIRVNSAGQLLYYVAGVAVLHDTDANTQAFFTGHDDDITSLTLSTDRTLAATGQQGRDACVCVWGAQDMAPVSVLHEAHKSTVAALAFSHDNTLLASVGGPPERQELIVWDWPKGRRVAQALAYSGKVEEVEWEHNSTINLVTCGQRHIKFWTLQGNVLRGRAGVWGNQGHPEDQLSVSCLPDGRVVSGARSGALSVWKDGKLESVMPDVHHGGVLVTEVYHGGLVTGGRDGSITLHHMDTLAPIATVPQTPSLVYDTAGPVHSLAVTDSLIVAGTEHDEVWVVQMQGTTPQGARCVVQGHGVGEVWGLATHPSRSLAATASDDCTVRLWDLTERVALATCQVPAGSGGARSVVFRTDGGVVAAGLKNGMVLLLETNHLEEQQRLHDRKEAVLDLKYSPDGGLLAVASSDNFVDIYNVHSNYQRVTVLSGASSFVTHIDWSSTSAHLQLNSGAGERLIYKVEKPDSVLVDESDLPQDMEWATWTGVLGKQVSGLWHKYADLSDINATDANFYYGVIVAGDDFGLVKLFRYPCPRRGAKSRRFVGHSEHVTNVRWTADSELVVSVGGADHALFLWRYRPSNSMRQPTDTVSLGLLSEEADSEEELLDTEDEYEGLPELSLDLETEQVDSGLKAPLRQPSAARSSRGKRRRPAVDIADVSTFARRANAKDDVKLPNELPDYYLKMKHVFGYRSHGCRDNAHWLADGSVVYHVAAVGIVLDIDGNRQRHYLHHTDDILCLTVHPDGETVASGQIGKDPVIHVWDSSSLRILSCLEGGHERGVSCLAFSPDGERLASIGLDDYNSFVIWDWKGGLKLSTARAHSDKVFGVRFSPNNVHKLITYGVKQAKLWTQVGGGLTWRQVKLGIKLRQEACLSCSVVGGSDGQELWLLGMSSGHILAVRNGEVEKKIKAHKKALHTIIFANNMVWSGGEDGYICQYDQELHHCLKVFPVIDHFVGSEVPVNLTSSQPGVRSLSYRDGQPMSLLVGTAQAELLLMATKGDAGSIGKFKIIVQGHSKGEVWGLDTHPSLQEAVTVSDDRTLRRWDLSVCQPLGSKALRKPARSVHFHPTAALIAVGFIDGSAALFSYPQLERTGGCNHRQESISDVKFSPDGRLLAVASHDSVVDLYVVDTDGDTEPKDSTGLRRVAVCRGASSFVTHVTWHCDSHLLQLNSGAGEELFYEAPSGRRQLLPQSASGALSWSSPLTCILDKTVEGIWEPGMDLTDVNAVATAHKLPLVVTTSDNSGLVRLFSYPCLGSLKKHRRYAGHSSHATNVRWSTGDDVLVTTGGGDTAVVVWRVLAPQDDQDDDFDAHVPPAPHSSPIQFAPPPTVPPDIPTEAITLKDLEVQGLDETMVLTPGTLKQHMSKEFLVQSEGSANENGGEGHGLESNVHGGVKLTALTSLHNDETIFFLRGNSVMKMDIAQGPKPPVIAHAGHCTPVTAMTLSTTEPLMIASACQEGSLVEESSSTTGLVEDEGAMVHVWRPSDGSLVTVLQGDSKDQVITCLSFSPKGRQLAFLADSATIYLFNWVKGLELAQKQLRGKSVLLSLVHVSETTLAVLTPRALLLCDLVGSALFVTPARAPTAHLPQRDVVFTSLTAQATRGLLYVGCSDGSVVEWLGRAAVRRVLAPAQRAHPPPRSATDVLVHTVAGNGVVFVVYRLSDVVRVQTYSTDEEHIKFFSEVSVKVPSPDWRPLSVRLGRTKLILGARQKQPAIVLNLTTSKFALYKPYG